MSSQSPAGWYPPDPNRPDELRYWNGGAWTDDVLSAAQPSTAGPARVPGWLVSWPAIILGFVLCLIPGLVLLWLRPTTSARVKGVVSAVALGLVVVGAVSEPSDPVGDATAVEAPVPKDTTTPSPSATTPSEAPRASSLAPSDDEATVTPSPSATKPSSEANQELGHRRG